METKQEKTLLLKEKIRKLQTQNPDELIENSSSISKSIAEFAEKVHRSAQSVISNIEKYSETGQIKPFLVRTVFFQLYKEEFTKLEFDENNKKELFIEDYFIKLREVYDLANEIAFSTSHI